MSNVNVRKQVGTILGDGINKYFLSFLCGFFMASVWELNCHTVYLAKTYFKTALPLTTCVAKLNGEQCWLNLSKVPMKGTLLESTGLYILEQSAVSGPWDENLVAT